MKNKRGETAILEITIFILLNLAFFVVMLMFVYSSGNRDFVYEQTYAKEIALIIDDSKPEMAILFDISELVEIAKENKKDINDVVKLDGENNRVFVSLKGERGYSYKYFTNAEVSFKIDKTDLIINIDKKINANDVAESGGQNAE